MLFYLLLFRPNDPRIEEIRQDKKFRKVMKNEVSVNQRLKAAYHYFREKNLPDTLDILNSADDYLDGFPTIGSRKREAQLINWLRNLMIEQGEPSNEMETAQPVHSVKNLNTGKEKMS